MSQWSPPCPINVFVKTRHSTVVFRYSIIGTFFFIYLSSPNLGLKTQMPMGQMPVGGATVFGPEH